MPEPVSHILQILPRRSTSPEGVGDYARVIAETLLRTHGIRTIFVAANAVPHSQRVVDEWRTHELDTRTGDGLRKSLAVLPDVPVILHLSSYGYQRKGTPIWLSRAIRRWRRENPTRPLLTIFHEISATGPIWGSAFWLGPWQKRIARQILHVSTGAIATTQGYAAILNAWRRHDTPNVLAVPVFSTIGEVESPSTASARPAHLIVFGRENVSRDLYGDQIGVVADFVQANKIEKIIDIGKRITPPPGIIGGASVVSLGESALDTVRAQLRQARFGLIAYDADRLAKSTVFSAYCAHGTVPVCLSSATGANDGIVPGRDYVLLSTENASTLIDQVTADALQNGARAWYGTHSTAMTADMMVDLLRAPEDVKAR